MTKYIDRALIRNNHGFIILQWLSNVISLRFINKLCIYLGNN
jgi:hypothetical protein